MRKVRLVMLCLACAGLLAVPAAADAQKQKPGGNQQGNSIKCRIATSQAEKTKSSVAGYTADAAKAKKTVAKRKKAYRKNKSAKNKRKLRKAKAAHKAAKTSLAQSKQALANAERRKASACS